MELTDTQKKFLLELLDKVQVQGIGNVVMIVSIYQTLSAQLAAPSDNGRAAISELLIPQGVEENGKHQ